MPRRKVVKKFDPRVYGRRRVIVDRGSEQKMLEDATRRKRMRLVLIQRNPKRFGHLRGVTSGVIKVKPQKGYPFTTHALVDYIPCKGACKGKRK